MQTAPNRLDDAAHEIGAQPPLTLTSLGQWAVQKQTIKDRLEAEIYGVMPKQSETKLISRRVISGHNYAGVLIEELELSLSYQTHNEDKETVSYVAVLLTPERDSTAEIMSDEPPIIMMENFCPNHSVIPAKGISRPANMSFSCDNKGITAKLIRYFFGRYIATPPIEMILSKGYGLAVIFPNRIFPDDAERFETLRAAAPDAQRPWGGVGAWAFQFSSLSSALSQIGYETTVAYGHSRYGKAALVAAAYDETIDGVIAHQSGTGGASLSKQKKGESVEAITRRYPHWFTPAYSEDRLTYDQHHLLALLAPRPLLLGNAKRDVWSDPEGAFRAAKAANAAYQIYGSDGLTAPRLTSFQPRDDIAFWMRNGTHGVVKEDWPAFLSFMDAHFR